MFLRYNVHCVQTPIRFFVCIRQKVKNVKLSYTLHIREMEVQFQSLLTSTLDGCKCPELCLRRYIPWERATRYQLNSKLRGSQSRSGRFGEQKHFSPVGIRNRHRPARSLITVPTKLFRLRVYFILIFPLG